MALKELIKRIDELQAQIQAHGKLDNETLKKINYKFRLDWNYNSNVMEGNSLTKLETRSVMINNITVEGKPLKDVLEMHGHDEVITSILKIGKAELNLSEKRILEIHKGIMYEDDPEKKKEIGIWKKDNNYLYNYKNERIDFASFTEVKEKMHELLNWLNTQKEKIIAKDKSVLHPVVLAFEFHLRYITIHPFYDGNGRTARILTNLILIAYGCPPVIIKLNEKDKYYQYLGDIQAYSGAPDLFYEFMGELLIHSQELVLKAIKGEDIEEQDDFDKKLTLFEKSIEKHEALDKAKADSKILKDLYFKFYKPFLIRLDEKFSKLDYLFLDGYYCGGYEPHNFYNLREDIAINMTDIRKLYANRLSNGSNGDFYIVHRFHEFKKSQVSFDVFTRIVFRIYELKYTIEIKIANKWHNINPFTEENDRVIKHIEERRGKGKIKKESKQSTEENTIKYLLYENYLKYYPSSENIILLADRIAGDTLIHIEDTLTKLNLQKKDREL